MALRYWHAGARRVVVTVLCGALLFVPAPAEGDTGLPELRDALQGNRGRLQDAAEGLAAVELRAAEAADALAGVEAALADAERRLAGLEAQQAAAQAAADAARRRLAVAEGDVRTAVTRVMHTVEQLQSDQKALGQQLASVYRGETTLPVSAIAGLLSESTNVSEFLVGTDQLRYATHRQSEVVDRVTTRTDELATAHAAVTAARDRVARERAAAEAALAEVTALATEQRALVERTRAQRDERSRLVAVIAEERERYTALVAELEEESEALAAELRRYRFVAGAPGDGATFVWPTDGGVSSGFGGRTHPIFGDVRQHTGIDIPAPAGQPIYAAARGRVLHAGSRGGYGNAVVLDHGNGLTTLYAHQARVVVRPGQVVDQAEHVGYVGSTGFSTGPHLHFEVRVRGLPSDPLEWFGNHRG